MATAALQRGEAVRMVLDCPIPDRVAESLCELAEVWSRLGMGDDFSEQLYEAARKKLADLLPHLNLPLRRRLAAVFPVN